MCDPADQLVHHNLRGLCNNLDEERACWLTHGVLLLSIAKSGAEPIHRPDGPGAMQS